MKKLKFLLTVIMLFAVLWCPVRAEAATAGQKQSCRTEISQMLYSVDTGTHSIYRYRMTVSEFKNMLQDMKTGDERLIWASYYPNMYVSYTTRLWWVDKIHIENTDSNVSARYGTLKKNVERIMSGVEPSMTDLDKILYLHDAVVETVNYRYAGYQAYGTAGALGENQAVCSGYTQAYRMLLDMAGIESNYMEGEEIDHGWATVLLDGKWYQVDPTWDDTRSGVSGQTGHSFLLCTDDEFLESGRNNHVGWHVFQGQNVVCDSERFTDWFVHDIKGKMLYHEGNWFYVDAKTGCIMEGNLEYGVIRTVCSKTAGKAVKLVKLDGDILTYTVDGVTDTLDVTVEEVKEPENTDKTGTTEEVKEPENTGETGTTEEDKQPESSLWETEYPDIEKVDFADYSNWRAGNYDHMSGNYAQHPNRICLKGWVKSAKQEYTVKVTDSAYHVLIRELDANGKFLKSYNLGDGESYIPGKNAQLLAISVYKTSGEYAIHEEDFAKMFANGFSAGIY